MSDIVEEAGECNPFAELAKARAWIDEAAAEIARLRAELDRTKGLLGRVTDDVSRYNEEARKARADRDAAKAEAERLREALSFYADEANYQRRLEADPCGCCSSLNESAIEEDEGEIAIAALQEQEKPHGAL